MTKKKYSILVNSCDAYSDAWPMFFYLLKVNWKQELPKIYLNTETKTYKTKELEVTVLNQQNPEGIIPWGERLRDALSRIPEDYVLMMLEDFYYESPIDISTIERCAEVLEKDNGISHIQLVPAGECAQERNQAPELFEGMIERKRFGNYTVIAGPTLWRKSDLYRLSKDKDTPWEWEFFGSKRTWFYGKKVYCWQNQEEHPIFDYDIIHGGAIHRGAWVGYKMRELEEKYNYKLEYGDRKVIEDWIKSEESSTFVPRNKRIRSIIHNRTLAITNPFYGMYLRFKKR